MPGLTGYNVKIGMIIFIVTLNAIFISGCWDRNEPENRAFVIGTGFDYDEESELYEITIQVSDPAGLGDPGFGGNDGEKTSVSVVSAKGQTPYHAAQNLNQHMTREPFWGHNKLLIISESLARRGIGPVLDYFDRERETRLIAYPAILPEEHSITEFFRTKLPFETFSGEGVERQIITIIGERSVFPSRTLIESFNVMSLPGKETIIGRITLGEQTEEDRAGEEGDPIRGTTHLEGGAVFIDGHMQGWFDKDQISGWFWVRNQVESALQVVNCPVHDEHPIAIEVYEVDTKKTPIITEEGEFKVEVDVTADGIMQDQTCPATYEREGELAKALNRRFATDIKNEIKDSIEQAQEYQADVFGLGHLFYRKKPHIFQEVEHEWNDIFAELTVDISVEANIRRTGMVTDPLITD